MTVPYTEAIVNAITDRIIDGDSIRVICAAEGMPSRSTLLRWLAEKPEFETKCARAWQIQADGIRDDLQDIADNGSPEDVQRAKLRVSVMQWRASKLAPKKYGDRVSAELSGPDGGPIQTESPDAAKLAQALLAALNKGSE